MKLKQVVDVSTHSVSHALHAFTRPKDQIDNFNKVDSLKSHTNQELWFPPMPLEHLDNEEQQVVQKMLREECNAFAIDDSDDRYIPSLQSQICLKDNTPVKRTYMSVPKPLCHEVKEYCRTC